MRLILPFIFVVIFGGCSSAYYSTMEKFGYHKRDILSSRVEKARNSQKETKEVFKSALDQFSSLVSVEGGDLQDMYNSLSSHYERSLQQRDELQKRVSDVENVAEALFREWKSEISQYSSSRLQSLSQQKYDSTQRLYEKLITKLRAAENSLDPVLTVFKDNVLYLKHNLNARAIGSLQGELDIFEDRVARLISSIDQAITESDRFIASLEEE